MLTLDLPVLSCNGLHLICVIVCTTSLYIIIVLLLFMCTQVFLRVHFLAQCFSPCILRLYLPLLSHSLSYTIRLLTKYNYGCLLPLMEYIGYFGLLSHVYVVSMRGQLPPCLNLMTTKQKSCLTPLIELSISISYLLQSLYEMLKFPSDSLCRNSVLHQTVILL